MSNSCEKFLDEIRETIIHQKYDKRTADKLLSIIVTSQILAERETNEDVKKILLHVSIVGEALAEKLYKLRDL